MSAAYAMASFVRYSLHTSDRNDVASSKLDTFFMLAFSQILNIDTQTAFAFTRHSAALARQGYTTSSPPSSKGRVGAF